MHFSQIVFFSINHRKDFGRRAFLLVGFTGLIFANFSLAMSAIYKPEMMPIFAVIFVLCHSSSLGPTSWIYCSEILPPVGVAFTTWIFWLFQAIYSFSFLYLARILGISQVFLANTAICIAVFFEKVNFIGIDIYNKVSKRN